MVGCSTRLKYLLLILVCGFLSAQTGARYLVITPDYFYNTLQPLVEWKYKKGMKPAVYRTSQIGSDTAAIRNFIVNCYNTWDITPEYVVLVGHPGYIPMHYYQYGSYNYYTDNYYTNMDGDWYNEILPGRISVADTFQLKTVINKIFAYERHPYTQDSSWFVKGCAIANCDGYDDSTYLYCMRYAESLAVHNDFIKVDTFCNYYGHTNSHVLNSINEGRNFVVYRGNANQYWYSPFNVDPYATVNGPKLPIILSTTCRTVSPNGTPILGESFLRAGIPTSLKGAVGFIGGTRNTGSAAHLRNAVAIGCLDALFVERKRTLGEVAEGGRLRVYQQYGEVREYNNFTCLGDPELNVWSAMPCSIVVQHPAFVPLGYSNFSVHVDDHTGTQPLGSVYVCVASLNDSSVYVLDTTDAQGDAHFNISPQQIDDTLYVTVTGRNLVPYEGMIIVKMIDYCYIVYLKSSINDSVFGNSDGMINPTEDIEFPLWVYNIGESIGVNIDATLRSNNPYITITDSMKNFSDVHGRDSAFTGSDGYNFLVNHSCPNQRVLNFELTCKDASDSTWISIFTKTVFAPELVFGDFTIAGGNGNNVVDPGETVLVVVTIGNQGDAAADSVCALLRCQSPEAGVLDSTGAIGHIGIDSLQDNTTDPFEIAVDSAAPIGTVLNCTVVVYSNYLNDSFDFAITVGQKNYYVWNPDPSPQSGQRIDSLLSNMGFLGDIGSSLPSALEMYQTIFICLGVYSNRYVIVHNSPEAILLTDYLNNGGRIYLESSSAWYIDPYYFEGHDFKPLFGISSTEWSYGDMGPVIGQTNTFSNGMYFNYTGENAYMDHINPFGGGFLIFRDVNNGYNCGVARDASIYKTVGTSFELGFLEDGSAPSLRHALLDSIMRFFGVPAPGVEEQEDLAADGCEVMWCNAYPNPFTKGLHLTCYVNPMYNASLKIFDESGRIVRDFSPLIVDRRVSSAPVHIQWDACDDNGRTIGTGVYFVYLEGGTQTIVKKVIFIK